LHSIFAIVVLNDLDCLRLVTDVIDRVPKLGPRTAHAEQAIRDRRVDHQQHIARYGEDMPEIPDWKWAHWASAREGGAHWPRA
jgi:xylulose-5-phosphate/fructose-6-phosphate phosphoketolase